MSYSDFFRRVVAMRIREFETSLLEWMRDETNVDALKRIEQTLTYLSVMERREPYRKLWWLSSGMAEALRYGTIESSALAKHLFAVVLAELRGQRDVDIEDDGGDRPVSPSRDLFDDIFVALKARKAPNAGPIMRNIANEFELGLNG